MGYADLVKADGAVGYWRLGEAAGSFVDVIAGNNGTVSGTPTRKASSLLAGEPFDGGVKLNNTPAGSGNDYVSIPHSTAISPTSAMTLECWASPSAAMNGNQYPILQKAYTSHVAPYYLYTFVCTDAATGHVGKTVLNFCAAPGGVFTPTPDTDIGHSWAIGEIHHLVGTYNGSTLALYVDGVLFASVAASGALTSAATTFYVGRYGNLANATGVPWWAGTVDEAAVYPTALSAARIKAHYKAGLRAGFVSGHGGYGG